MITLINDNIFNYPTDVIVNTVNLQGVMGKGLALEFKNRYPKNFNAYKLACKNNQIGIGKVFITDKELNKDFIIVNFPTKVEWKYNSKISYILKGLDNMLVQLENYSFNSLSIPSLGCCNGGLNKAKVIPLIMETMSNFYSKDKLKELDIKIFI